MRCVILELAMLKEWDETVDSLFFFSPLQLTCCGANTEKASHSQY